MMIRGSHWPPFDEQPLPSRPDYTVVALLVAVWMALLAVILTGLLGSLALRFL
jgi:hypothetical protein